MSDSCLESQGCEVFFDSPFLSPLLFCLLLFSANGPSVFFFSFLVFFSQNILQYFVVPEQLGDNSR